MGEVEVKPFHDANAGCVAGQTEEQMCVDTDRKGGCCCFVHALNFQ
jgi:hypothetical protein